MALRKAFASSLHKQLISPPLKSPADRSLRDVLLPFSAVLIPHNYPEMGKTNLDLNFMFGIGNKKPFQKCSGA